jgi:pre-mRNA-splicing factor ATP-dependent RNA helicase DHX15/PRP43
MSGPPPGPPPSKPLVAATPTSVPKENPYLAHLPPAERYTNGNGSSSSSSADPLAGFIPRKTQGSQVRKVLEGDMNPFAAAGPRPYTQKYKDILAKRKALPVYAQMDEFYEKFNESQIMVMIGETGSGKTTQ